MKRLFGAWLACSATNILIGILFHRFVIGEQLVAIFRQLGSEPRPVLALSTHLVITTVLVYLYARGRTGQSPILEGYKLGVAVGVLAISPIVFIFMVMGVNTWTIATDAFWHIFIEEPITGVVAGLVYRTSASG